MRPCLTRTCLAAAVAAALLLPACVTGDGHPGELDQVGVDPTGETVATTSPTPPKDAAEQPGQPNEEQEFVAPQLIPAQPRFGQSAPDEGDGSAQEDGDAGVSHPSHRAHRRRSR